MFKVAAADLINMGISVVSYTLKDIRDDHVGVTKINLTWILFSVLLLLRWTNNSQNSVSLWVVTATVFQKSATVSLHMKLFLIF